MSEIVMVKFSDGYYGLRREVYDGHYEFLSITLEGQGYWFFQPEDIHEWCKFLTKNGCKKALGKYEKYAKAQPDIGVPV